VVSRSIRATRACGSKRRSACSIRSVPLPIGPRAGLLHSGQI
jgi:hypothetical protein